MARSGSTLEDVAVPQDEVVIGPLSFGIEMELKLVPFKEKIAEARAMYADLDSVANDLEAIRFDSANKDDKRTESMYKTRSLWCNFITILLKQIGNVDILYDKSPLAKKEKYEGTYYRHWTVIEEVNLSEVPDAAKGENAVTGECMRASAVM